MVRILNLFWHSRQYQRIHNKMVNPKSMESANFCLDQLIAAVLRSKLFFNMLLTNLLILHAKLRLRQENQLKLEKKPANMSY